MLRADAGFVDIFIGEIPSENDYEIPNQTSGICYGRTLHIII